MCNKGNEKDDDGSDDDVILCSRCWQNGSTSTYLIGLSTTSSYHRHSAITVAPWSLDLFALSSSAAVWPCFVIHTYDPSVIHEPYLNALEIKGL